MRGCRGCNWGSVRLIMTTERMRLQARSLIDGADGAEAMLMSPSSLRSEQTAGGMLASPSSRSMLSSRLDAPPHAGDAAGAPATATASATVSAMATPRSMGRVSTGDSMTSSRTLTVAADAASSVQGVALPLSAQRKPAAPSVWGGAVRGDMRRQPSRRLQSQEQAQQELQPLAAVAKGGFPQKTFGRQGSDAAMQAKQPLPPPAEEHDKVHRVG